MQTNNTSIEMIEVVASRLKHLLDQVVFIGGSVASLYGDQSSLTRFRPTDDVDCVIEITSRIKYFELEEQLRALGFDNDTSLICRWNIDGVIVDIMPIDEKILGFTNQWYTGGFENKIEINLPSKTRIYIFALAYFIASKLEALNNRGGTDLRLAHDLEDVLMVLDACKDPLPEIEKSPSEVKSFLAKNISKLLSLPNINEILLSNFPSEQVDRINRNKSILEKIAKL